jgi:galactose mutarotase-like enzyme
MNARLFQNQPVLEIRSGDATALVTASHGAKLLRWHTGRHVVIDWPTDANWNRVVKVRGGNPVLFPFIARTYDHGNLGLWRDAQGAVRTAPMHGFAKDSPFHVVDAAADFVTLRLCSNDTTRACFPFDFQFDVTHTIGPDWLQTDFFVTNTGDSTLPWTAGHHYYFAIPASERPEWLLHIPCKHWGRQNPSTGDIVLEPCGVPRNTLDHPGWIDRFHDAPDINHVTLARRDGTRSIAFQSPTSWACVTTWTETPESPFFCVEPWSAYPNAIHSGLGLRILPPGASDRLSCRVVST